MSLLSSIKMISLRSLRKLQSIEMVNFMSPRELISLPGRGVESLITMIIKLGQNKMMFSKDIYRSSILNNFFFNTHNNMGLKIMLKVMFLGKHDGLLMPIVSLKVL